MSTWRGMIAPMVLVAVATTAAVPAAAQFSDSYKFLKAAKDKDIGAANKILSGSNSTIVNVRDPDGETALHLVVRGRNSDWIRFLWFKGADVNLTNRDGATPLLLAATTGYDEGVDLLIGMKARVDIKNRQGETALIKAVQARDSSAVKSLLEAGANADISDNTGSSARKYAAADPRGGPVARLLKDAPVGRSAPMQGPSL